MTALPTGTLTMLFSDIEGSTALLRRLGADWGAALSAHRAILRGAFAEQGGVELGTEGDSFFVVFRSARKALAAAVTAQRNLQRHDWPAGGSLRVRMGLHTGEPEPNDEGYVGEDVHRAARIAATAHGGQIVLSAETGRLAHDLPDITLRDLGHHRLKDFPDGDRLFDVVAPGLPASFPPLRSLGRVAALPTWTTPLVGRDRDLPALVAMLADPATRVVTLTGPGGCGKTRLATAAAAALESRYPDGLYFVGLSAVRDVAGMWTAIRDVLDLGGAPAEDVAGQVTAQLRDRSALLVLDNLEQIHDAESVVHALSSAAPGVDALASSRRPLLLVGAREYPVAPLAVPESGDLDAVLRSPAAAVFADQARLARPSFEITPDNAAAVAAVCRRLDGLPLALELAAAQTRLLSASALLTRIDGRLGATFAATDRPDRQRTLHTMIAWSYELLSDDEQSLFRRLGVFRGGADLAAVAAVSDCDPTDALTGLVEANMVRVGESPDGEPTINLLETIRRFAAERLDEAGECEAVCQRHLAWCLDAVDAAVPLLRSSRHTMASDRLHALDDDIRAALEFAFGGTGPSVADRRELGPQLLITVTTRYWYLFGSVAEARQWEERALAVGDARDSEANIGLLFGLGVSLLQQGVLTESLDQLDRARAMAARLRSDDWEARVLNAMAIARRQAGEYAESTELLQRSLALSRSTGNDELAAKALGNLVVLHHDQGDYDAALRTAEDALALNAARGDDWAVAIDRFNYIAALLPTAGAHAAGERFVEWMPSTLAFGETELVVDVLELGGAIAAELGAPQVAAQLLGAADTRRASAGTPRSSAEQGRVAHWVDRAREALPADQWQHAYDAGAVLTSSECVDLVCKLTG